MLRVFGQDSARFLQGQLSADLRKLAPGEATLAGLHSREGRVLAVLRVLASQPDELLLILPHELLGDTLVRLRQFVLRAKAQLADATDSWQLLGGMVNTQATGGLRLPWGRDRQVTLLPRTAEMPPVDSAAETLAAWRAADIADGLPQVYAATSDAFVSQMLNLDVLGGIAFDKGCYTGQEIIARAHYRGRVKRRMQRFLTHEAVALAPGDSGTLTSGGSFKVVDCVTHEDGRVEFLAVAPLGSATGEAPQARLADEARPLAAEMLALPYELPT